MTAHNDFERLNLPRINDAVRTAIIVDCRRIFDAEGLGS
jgi:UDP-glucose 6-dehydrogenase